MTSTSISSKFQFTDKILMMTNASLHLELYKNKVIIDLKLNVDIMQTVDIMMIRKCSYSIIYSLQPKSSKDFRPWKSLLEETFLCKLRSFESDLKSSMDTPLPHPLKSA
ncbi:hypothetical protein EUGRSUZ_B02187 [Eucalyptus grandis]|uniref:Uncharacterized protein n=2 Tax=Eucalyptus grandis TaxID=71139 RepID=A0ACC3LSX4_EUCGR|nr:hypothetical protein EUGRSUZ_B02187 [Eucalyptus grandis]